MAKCRANQRGFTLVELMIVVAIVAILAAMAIYGVRKYVSHAKTTEVTNALGQMTKDASSAYVREKMAGSIVQLNFAAQKSNQLCPSGPPVPFDATRVQGQKYQSSPVDWSGGWQCLRFAMQDPQYYRYTYSVAGTGPTPGANAGDSFEVKGTGDLDGDTKTSRFTFMGAIIPDGAELVLLTAPNVSQTDPEE